MNRNVLNLAMTIGLVAVMDYRFTGNAAHEILGVFLAALLLLHNILNHRWYQSISKGRQNLLRVVSTAANLLLLAMIIVVLVTGVLISQTLFSAFSLSGHLWVHQLHTFSAYASFALCGIHLGLHGNTILGKVCRGMRLDAPPPTVIWIGRIAAVVIIGYGIRASFSHQIGSKLLFEHVFGGWGDKPALIGFLTDYPAILGCYALGTHFLERLLLRPRT